MSNSAAESRLCERVSAQALSPQIANGFLLDVRSPIEFEAEHIEGAVNIPLSELESRLEELPRQGKITLVCRSGMRAERAAYLLMGQGLKPLVLEGGMLTWKKSGLAVVKGKQMLPIERQIQLIVGLGVLTGLLLGLFLSPYFLILPAFFGAGLTFAGLTGTCGLALILQKAPWNQLPGLSGQEESKHEKNSKSCCG